jgi:hypothetical protein
MASHGHAHRFGPFVSSTSPDGPSHVHTIDGKKGEARSSGPLDGDGGHVHRAIIDGEEMMSGPPIDTEKLGVGEMVPGKLRDVDAKVNAALFVWAEMQRRGIRIARDSDLWRAAQTLTKADVPVDKLESAMSDREARYEHAAIEGWAVDGGGADGEVDAP